MNRQLFFDFQAGNFLEELRKVAAIIIDRTICFRKIATLFFGSDLHLSQIIGNVTISFQ